MDAKSLTTIIGAAAAAVSVASFVPQIIKMARTKDASGVSRRTYAFTVMGFALWVVYGLRLSAWPIVAANACALGLSGAILILKWRYTRRAPQRKLRS